MTGIQGDQSRSLGEGASEVAASKPAPSWRKANIQLIESLDAIRSASQECQNLDRHSEASRFIEAVRLVESGLADKRVKVHGLGLRCQAEMFLGEILVRLAQLVPAWIHEIPHDRFPTVRSANIAAANRLNQIAEIRKQTPRKIQQIPMMGVTSLRDIIEALVGVAALPTLMNPEPITPQPEPGAMGKETPSSHVLSGTAAGVPEMKYLTVKEVPPVVAAVVDLFVHLDRHLDAMAGDEAVTHKEVRVIRVLRRRLEGSTLLDLGREYDVTRERVRQLEALGTKLWPWFLEKLIRWLINDGRTDTPLWRAVKAFLSSQRLLEAGWSPEDSQKTLPFWLSFLADRPSITPGMTSSAQRRLIGKILGVDLLPVHAPRHLESADGLLVPSTSGASDPDQTLKQFHQALERHALETEERYRCLVAGDLLLHAPYHPAFIAIIAHWAFEAHMKKMPSGRLYPEWMPESTWRGKAVRDIFATADLPIHALNDFSKSHLLHSITEYENGVTAAGYWITSAFRNEETESPERPSSIGNGFYANRRMMNLSVDQSIIIAKAVADLLRSNPGRQFSNKELVEHLRSVDAIPPEAYWPRDSWPGMPRIVVENLVQVPLNVARHPETRYLGRYLWLLGEWTDEPDAEGRVHIQSFLKSLLADAGKPLQRRDMMAELDRVRGTGRCPISHDGAPQIREKDGIYRLSGRGIEAYYWDESLGAPPAGVWASDSP